MKWFIYNVAILIMLCAYVEVHAQNNVPLTRTPEQEAIKQTERMQSRNSWLLNCAMLFSTFHRMSVAFCCQAQVGLFVAVSTSKSLVLT